MISCKGCPFLYSWDDAPNCVFLCNLGYDVITMPDLRPISEDCKLEAVTYSLKDKKDSIDFIPKETDDSN